MSTKARIKSRVRIAERAGFISCGCVSTELAQGMGSERPVIASSKRWRVDLLPLNGGRRGTRNI